MEGCGSSSGGCGGQGDCKNEQPIARLDVSNPRVCYRCGLPAKVRWSTLLYMKVESIQANIAGQSCVITNTSTTGASTHKARAMLGMRCFINNTQSAYVLHCSAASVVPNC